jgi:micrococcal nuclease
MISIIGVRGGGRGIGAADVRAMIWTGLLCGLLWVNFERWTVPGPSPELPFGTAPDPWAEARRDRIGLKTQEGAPPSALSAGSGTITSSATIRSAVRVVDGDTFWVGGDKIRIADIDTPETHPPRCAYEAELGEKATRRLAALLGEGPFELAPIGGRDVDRYGRKLRIVMRDGRSLGDRLVSEGLARTWTGRRQPWCA